MDSDINIDPVEEDEAPCQETTGTAVVIVQISSETTPVVTPSALSTKVCTYGILTVN